MSVSLAASDGSFWGGEMNPVAEGSLAAGDDEARAVIDQAHSLFCKTRGIKPSQESIERFANHRTDYDALTYEGRTWQQLVLLLRDRLSD